MIRLVGESQTKESVDSESTVSKPTVSIIPIATWQYHERVSIERHAETASEIRNTPAPLRLFVEGMEESVTTMTISTRLRLTLQAVKR